MKKRIEAHISGRVQMVFFRHETMQKGKALSLVGQVWNNDDGTVSVIAEGDEDKLRIFCDYLKKGPSGAKIEEVKISWEEASGELSDFEIVS